MGRKTLAVRTWTEVEGMRDAGELAQENDALRERLPRLREARLSISESLDFDAVLQWVLDSALSLTGAR